MGKLIAGQHIHLVGIGGAGLSAIARVLLQRGFRVSGSDRATNAFTDALARDGATIYNGHDAAHVRGADVVIVSSAVARNHVEIAAARALGVRVYKRSEVIADVMQGKVGIAIAGTHGKTTTTAMTAHILLEAGQQPSYIIGGVLKTSGQNANAGDGAAFVIEADEYDNMFHGLRPQVSVITNVEWDHPDFFPTPDDLMESFAHFADLLPPDGLLIVCADSPAALRLAESRLNAGLPAMTYAIEHEAATWRALDIRTDAQGRTGFALAFRGEVVGDVMLRVPGAHNVLNAMAAMIAAVTQGVGLEDAIKALDSFEGTGRRFEVRADVGGVAVVDDYAHHPTAIRVTLDAARQRYPDREVWAVWQPHTYSRTRALWADYLTAFEAAEHVLVTDIYAAREQPVEDVTSAAFVAAMRHADARHTPTLDDAANALVADVRAPAVIVIMSAGDAPRIGVAFVVRWGKG